MYFDDISLNKSVDIEPVRIEKDKMLEFAREYDHIPLHTDEEYAKTTHFGALIAPGVMSFMSVWSKYLERDFIGKELIAGQSIKIVWHKPVFAEDVLTGRAVVTGLEKRNEKNGLVEITVSVHNQNGEIVLKNIVEAVVKRRQ